MFGLQKKTPEGWNPPGLNAEAKSAIQRRVSTAAARHSTATRHSQVNFPVSLERYTVPPWARAGLIVRRDRHSGISSQPDHAGFVGRQQSRRGHPRPLKAPVRGR